MQAVCVCSEWGRSRVVAHHSVPLNLVLPVLTKSDVVQQAVVGVLSGQISLSMSSVEALLVLANAVGVSHMHFESSIPAACLLL